MSASVPSPLVKFRLAAKRSVFRDMRPLAAGVTVEKNGLVSCWPGGYYGPAGSNPASAGGPAAESAPVGRWYDALVTPSAPLLMSGTTNTATNTGAAGAASANVQFFHERLLFLVDNDPNAGAVTLASRERMVSLLDDHTATQFGLGFTDLGIMYDLDSSVSPNDSVWVELVFPSSAQNAQAAGVAGSTPGRARMVAKALPAYTGSGTGTLTASATGLIGALNGVTPKLNDVIHLPEDATNLSNPQDAGPYEITTLGAVGVAAVYERPSWWPTGAVLPLAAEVTIGGEDNAWAGITWRSFAAAGTVIDTSAPQMYPRATSVTTPAAVAGVTPANATLYVSPSALVTPIPFTPAGTAGIWRMTTQTPGKPGTSSLVATSSNAGDTSTVKLNVLNF